MDSGDERSDETTDRRWTVLTWNVHGVDRPDVESLARAIGVESPDVVLLQEVRRSQARRLATHLGMRYRWDCKHVAVTPRLLPHVEGLALLSAHPLADHGHAVISSYRWAWSYRRRIAQWAAVRAEGGFWVGNVHLSPHGLADERREEARRTATIAAEHADGLPVVVGGDLNDADDPTVIDLLPGVEHVRPTPTNPAADPRQVLDHVLLPADARDVETTVPDGGAEWAALSDHLPVTCRFRLA